MEATEPVYSDKQKAILDAAEELFALNGFNGTSVRDIANKADVNVAMISYYFGSKDKLLEALFERSTFKIRLKVEYLLNDKSTSPLEKVNILIDDYIDKFLQKQQFHAIMYREQMLEKDSVITALIFDLKMKNMESIKQLIHEGQKTGAFKKNIDISLMMTTMVGTVSHMMTSKLFYKKINHLEHLSEADFMKHIRKKLSFHLKYLFKQILTNEA